MRVINLLYFSKCIISEVSIQNNKGYTGIKHRSPSHDNEFQSFLSNFETILSDTKTNNASIYYYFG